MNSYVKLLKDSAIKEEIIAMYNMFYTGLDLGIKGMKYTLCLEDNEGEGNVYVIPYINEKPQIDQGIILTVISKDNNVNIKEIIENKIKELNRIGD